MIHTLEGDKKQQLDKCIGGDMYSFLHVKKL